MTKASRFGAAGLLLALALPLGACESGADPTLTRAGIGAGGGAAVGGLIGSMSGNFGWGALIGAGAGAAGGLLFDYHQREREAQFQRGVQERGLAMLLGRDDAVALVAEHDGAVAGMCTVQLSVSTARGGLSAGIEDVVVTARCRGRGIGGLLVAAAERWAVACGAVRIALLADETNAPALDFYDHLGFTRTRLVWLAKPLDETG